MNITEIFKDSFNYSTIDWVKMLILGALLIGVAGFLSLSLTTALYGQFVISIILAIIAIIYSIFVGLTYEGYSLSIIRDTINGVNDVLPKFDWINNLVDGFKVLVLNFLYCLVPAIVGMILAFVLGAPTEINALNNMTSPTTILLAQTSAAMSIANIITFVLAVLFSLISTIAMARLAETGRLGSIFEFGEIFNTISNIGWGNYIAWFILNRVIIVVIAAVAAVICIIPIVGIFAYLLFIPGFLTIFASRATGLIYNESK